ncbi:MAG: glycosyltransferase family 2 protein [bacterium]|nr:glycosyltransferase family 2 protein [bacterium]
MSQPRVSVIIPTYNEAENVPILLERLGRTLADIPHEIIVVDDNSPDGTWQVAEQISLNSANLRVIRRLNERGLSSAVVAGMSAAKGQCLAVMDSDLQHDEAALPEMIETVLAPDQKVELAIGSRGVAGGSYGDFSKGRRFMSWVAAAMARMMLPVNVKDPMSGFFVVRREVFVECADRINPLGFKILLEFIGRNPGIKIKEVGYSFRLREHGETKLSGSVIRNYIIALYDMRFGQYVSSTFMMYAFVGSTGVLVNLLGFALGEFLRLPRFTSGLPALDPLYLSVPFGIQLSIITNYFLNNYITFYESRHKGSALVKGLVLFQIISMVGIVIQWSVFQLLQTNGFLAGMLEENLRSYANNAIGIILATVGNYYLNLNVTWGLRGKPSA